VKEAKKTEIARVSELAWRRTLEVVASVAALPPPTPLNTIASLLSIDKIRFAPLVSDAGLARDGEKFEIVVNTEASPTPYAAGTVLLASDSKWSDLHATLRFTVAHEIAHVIFLQQAGFDQESEFFQKNERAVENACNILARVLLLPAELLRREVGNRLFDPKHLAEVAGRCRVSAEVLVRRFHVSDLNEDYFKSDGFIALARQVDNAIRVKACHIFGAIARDRFHRALKQEGSDKTRPLYRSLSDSYAQSKWALEGQSIDEIQLAKDLESKLGDGDVGPFSLRVGWGSGKVIPCSLSSHPLVGGALVLCLKVAGPVQESDQERLL
jgi:Zn-dependent peptidase ImmA (M78 family)